MLLAAAAGPPRSRRRRLDADDADDGGIHLGAAGDVGAVKVVQALT